jgi:tetratricopeptide (TPR) repeat protein
LRSRRHLERVIALDPGFAPAYAALARERLVSGDRAAARRLALQAEDRDPGLAAAHAVLGELALVEDWDVETAEARLRRAVRLEPEEPAHRIALGFVLAVSGRPEPAAHEVQRALEADPIRAALRHDAGLVLYWSRRYDEALRQCDLVSELEPERWWAEDCSIDALVRLGRANAAAERVARLLRGWGVDPAALGWRHDHTAEQRLRLYREWRLRRREAKRDDTHPPLDFEIATLHAELGNPAAALDALSRAASRRSQAFVAAAAEPRFDALRGEPRFRALIAPLARPGQPSRSRRST